MQGLKCMLNSNGRSLRGPCGVFSASWHFEGPLWLLSGDWLG